MLTKKPTPKTLHELVPAYLNRTLSVSEHCAVEDWLRRDLGARTELMAWQQLRNAAIDQPKTAPAPAVKQRLMARTRTLPQASSLAQWLPWACGAVLAALVLIALWIVIQPGIGLQWSVTRGSPSGFKIYRAPVGSSDFDVVHEVPAQPDTQNYTYVDTPILPNQSYVYRVDSLEQDQSTQSQTVAVSTQVALVDQLMMLLTSLIIGCNIAIFVRYRLQLNSYSNLTRVTIS